VRIKFEKDEEKDGKSPQGGTPVAEEGKGYSYHREETNGHPDVDGEVKEQNAGNTIAVHPRKATFLSFGEEYHAEKQHYKETDHQKTSDPSVLLANCAKDKIRTLLGDELEFGLGSFQESFSIRPAAANGHLGLINVISGAQLIEIRIQQNPDTLLLVLFEDVVKNKIHALYCPH
jgi:hypothetical protein